MDLIHVFPPNPRTSRASTIRIHSCGSKVVYCSEKSVVVRSPESKDGKGSLLYSGHGARVTVAKFSPCGTYVASGDASGQLRVWSLQDEKSFSERHAISIKSCAPISDLAWSHDSKLITITSTTSTMKGQSVIVHALTDKSCGALSGSACPLVACAMSKNNTVATLDQNGECTFYQLNSTSKSGGDEYKIKKINVIREHRNIAYDLAFCSDGKILASCGANKEIMLYNGETGDFIGNFSKAEGSHTGSIYALTWSLTDHKLYTAGSDGFIKEWLIKINAFSIEEATMELHLDESKSDKKADFSIELLKTMKDPKFSPRGNMPNQMLGVCCLDDASVVAIPLSGKLITFCSDETIRTIYGHQNKIELMTFFKYGPESTLYIITSSIDGVLLFWDWNSGVCMPAGSADRRPTQNISADCSNNEIAIASSDSYVSIIKPTFTEANDGNGESAQLQISNIAMLQLKHRPIGIAMLTADYKVIATVSDIKILLKDQIHQIAKISYQPSSIASQKNTYNFAVGDESANVHFLRYSSDGLTETKTVNFNRGTISAIEYSPDGKYIACGDYKGRIVVIDLKDYKKVTDAWSAHTGRISAMSWSPCGKYLASVSYDSDLNIYNLDDPYSYVIRKGAHLFGATGVHWASNSNIITCGSDGGLKEWRYTNYPNAKVVAE